jgi:hypothetical protein
MKWLMIMLIIPPLTKMTFSSKQKLINLSININILLFMDKSTETLSAFLIEHFNTIDNHFFQLPKLGIKLFDYQTFIIENMIYNFEETGDNKYSQVIDYILDNDPNISLRIFISNIYDKMNKEHNINLLRTYMDKDIGKKIFELYTQKYNLATLFNKELLDKFDFNNEKKYFNKINNVVNTFDNFKIIINSDDIFNQKYNDFYLQIEQILQLIKETLI